MKPQIRNSTQPNGNKWNLPGSIFNAEWNPDLVKQALNVQAANSRQTLAHAKGRGEVRGGGRKPWRQKGTGRARHGSIRSPLWTGGGVTFGPNKEENFARRINKKMKRLALFSVLSKKLKDSELKIVERLDAADGKTKNVKSALLKILPESEKNTALIISGSVGESFKKAVRNLRNVSAISPKSLNVYDLLKSKYIILDKEAVDIIAKHFIKKCQQDEHI